MSDVTTPFKGKSIHNQQDAQLYFCPYRALAHAHLLTQGAASLALGLCTHWAFSPSSGKVERYPSSDKVERNPSSDKIERNRLASAQVAPTDDIVLPRMSRIYTRMHMTITHTSSHPSLCRGHNKKVHFMHLFSPWQSRSKLHSAHLA